MVESVSESMSELEQNRMNHPWSEYRADCRGSGGRCGCDPKNCGRNEIESTNRLPHMV